LILRVEDPKEEKNPQGSSRSTGSDPKEEKNPQGSSTSVELVIMGKTGPLSTGLILKYINDA